jgi:ankyrin repeat protein
MQDLISAVKSGDAERVATLLDADPSLLGASENGTSAILLAMYYRHPEVAQLFVDRGAKLTIHEAAAVGDSATVRAQLDADPSLLDRCGSDGFQPLGLAIFFRHPELARMLIERGADVSAPAQNAMHVAPLHAAAAVSDRDSIELLLARGADPNARQQSDYTPLHDLAGRGDIELAKLLVARGADRNAKTSDGKTPSDLARDRGHAAFVEWINGTTI